jgi:hypothetical protein
VTLLLALSIPARAEDSTFTGAQAAAATAPETHVTGELGGSYASGNANYYAVNGLLNASHQVKKNKVSGVAGINVGGAKVTDLDADGVPDLDPRDVPFTENARRLYADLRYDRFLSEKDALYALAGVFHDPFLGFDTRSHEQVGYSRRLVKNDRTELRGELGVDLAQENYVEGIDPNLAHILAARILVGVNHQFNDQVSIAETFELYENVLDVQDVRVLNTAALTSRLSEAFSVKLSHSLLFDNVPVAGLRKLDQVSMVTLVATLL